MKRLIEVATLLCTFLFPAIVFAEEAAGAPEGTTVKVALALASGFGIAIAAFGGAFGQAKAITAAMEGISRNPEAQPRMFVLLILGLAFIESLVIYAFVVSLMLQGKI